jgi:hypothetical protein
MWRSVVRAIPFLLFAELSGACALVDQYGSRAYDGNLNTQNAINQEVLVNIVRASRYQALSWNPASQIQGGQTETLSTGLPTINIGPAQTAANHIYSITNSVSSGVTGGFTTAPLSTTAFQVGMLTPVDLKIIAALSTYYPREVVLYALIAAIDVKLVSSNPKYARLINDPGAAYYDVDDPSNLNQKECYREFDRFGPDIFFGTKNGSVSCSYAKFRNLLGIMIANGLYTELAQIPAPQPAQAQANQSNIVTVGRFCFNKPFVSQEFIIQNTNFPRCGQDKKQNAGGTVQVVTTETHKREDVIVNTDTKSALRTITTTSNSILPITGRTFRLNFTGIGPVEITFEMRSPDGFLSYLGSWYRVRGKLEFVGDERPLSGYGSVPAKQIFAGGPYLSISDGVSASCYSSVNYSGQSFCVPMEATHTSMLMDIAVILRNLNISPTDLNAPISVKVAN